MDEFELYPGQNTGEKIDQAVDVVQAAIDAAQLPVGGTIQPDAYIVGVEPLTMQPDVVEVSGSPISIPEVYTKVTVPTRALFVSETRKNNNEARYKCIKAVFSGVSSLPQTVRQLPTYSSLNLDDCEVVAMRLTNPGAQTGPWTVAASGLSVTVSGSISGTTDIEIFLAKPGMVIDYQD